MADKDEYNGWANHMTWLVKLHLDSTEGWQQHTLALMATCPSDDLGRCGELLKDYVEELILPRFLNTDGTRFANDVLTSALADVQWRDLAEAFREELNDGYLKA